MRYKFCVLALVATVTVWTFFDTLAPLTTAQQASCPSASTTQIQGTIAEGAQQVHLINLLPCQTVLIEFTGSIGTHPQRLGPMILRLRNAAGQNLEEINFLCGASCTSSAPTPGSSAGYPLPGTAGTQGLAKDLVIKAGIFNIYSASSVSYTVTITKQPRPGYNLGATSTSDAPLIQKHGPQYGSVHPFEPGQFYKIHLRAGEALYLAGSARGTPYASNFKVNVLNSSGISLKTIVNVVATGTPTTFPASGANPDGYTFRNTGPAAYFFIKVTAGAYVTQDFGFIPVTDGPRLTLFLDSDPSTPFDIDAPHSDHQAYVPGANAAGASVALPQQMQLIAAYVDSSGVIVAPPSQGISFALSNTSAFTGIAMNAGEQTTPDYLLTSTTASFTPDNTARVTLSCLDYGGFTTIVATDDFQDRAVVFGSSEFEMRLPVDDDDDWLPDTGWNTTLESVSEQWDACDSPETCDIDDEPQASVAPATGRVGDGFGNFEEFRGFLVRGEHRRTSPSRKDLFMSSTLDVGIVYAFPAMPVRTHRLRDALDAVVEYEPATRIVNFNYTNSGHGGNIPGRAAQRALRVIDGIWYSDLLGCTILISNPICGFGEVSSPNETERLEVYTQTIQSLADFSNFTSEQRDNAVRKIVGHEAGHGVGMCHHDQNCGAGAAGPSLMDIGFFSPSPGDSRANYNSLDKPQIRLHRRF